MKISGRFGVYECKWVQAGWSYADVVVRQIVEKNFLGVIHWDAKEKVWESSGRGIKSLTFAQKAHPERLRAWYTEVVEEFEDWYEAWVKELEG